MWYLNLLNNYSFFENLFKDSEKNKKESKFDDDYYDALHNYGDANMFFFRKIEKK